MSSHHTGDVSHCSMACHIISHHIVSHHIMSYHTKSSRIRPYNVICCHFSCRTSSLSVAYSYSDRSCNTCTWLLLEIWVRACDPSEKKSPHFPSFAGQCGSCWAFGALSVARLQLGMCGDPQNGGRYRSLFEVGIHCIAVLALSSIRLKLWRLARRTFFV